MARSISDRLEISQVVGMMTEIVGLAVASAVMANGPEAEGFHHVESRMDCRAPRGLPGSVELHAAACVAATATGLCIISAKPV